MDKNILFVAAMTLVLASGCSARKVDQQLVAEPDPVTLRLAMAADNASSALSTLAAIEQAKNPSQSIAAVPDAPQELRRIISVDYDGPIEPMAKTLADRAGYQLEINGTRPPAPMIVSVHSREKSVIEVLRDIGLQAGRRADVAVDPDRRMVELDYASNFSE